MRKQIVFLLAISLALGKAKAQVAINNTATNPNASAILDLNSGNVGVNKGFLAPQVALTNINIAAPVTSPAIGLMVYSTSAPTGGNGKGYYYWGGSAWITLGASALSSVNGSGIHNYVARWTPNGNTLGTGLIRDDSNSVGINAAPNPGFELFVNSSYPTGIAAFSFDTAVEGNTANAGVGVYGKGYWGVFGFSNYGPGVIGQGDANYGVEGTSKTGTGVYGISANNIGIYGEGDNNIGVVGISLLGKGVSATGGTYGIWGYSTSPSTGVGVFGEADSNIAVLGYAPQGTGVYGWSVGNYGVYGLSSSTTFAGVYGDNGNGYGVEGISSSGTGVYGTTNDGYGVQGFSSDSVGVFGQGDKVYGVEGTSTNGDGVHGVGGLHGVYGYSMYGKGVYGSGGIYGVYGLSASIGVYGNGENGYGVYAISALNVGVYGSGADTGIEGISINTGVYGSGGSNGVYGYSMYGNGVYAQGGGYGVYANSAIIGVYGQGGNSYGVEGISINKTGVYGMGDTGVVGVSTGNIGVYGNGDTGVKGYGAYTGISGLGNISGGFFMDADGDFSYIAYSGSGILSNGTKSTMVKDENNQERVLFCNESPEVMFEDYGEGQLVNGKAHVNLDPLFAKNVAISEKHPLRVFIQLNDTTSKGVAVINRTPTGFDVIDLNGKKCNTPFEWHIICNRANEAGAYRNYADKRFPVGPGPLKKPDINLPAQPIIPPKK